MGPCQRCKKRKATFHLTNISRDGEKVERHLCEECAVEEGLVHKPSFSQQLIETLLAASKSISPEEANLVCEECGLSYREFINQGLLGCPNDYDAFREPLARLIERSHEGATQHVGKSPRSLGAVRTTQQQIRQLKRQLDEAVAAEDYERAAELRDRIRELEQT